MSVESGWNKKTRDERLHSRNEKSVRCMWAHGWSLIIPCRLSVKRRLMSLFIMVSVLSLLSSLWHLQPACHMGLWRAPPVTVTSQLIAVLLTGEQLVCVDRCLSPEMRHIRFLTVKTESHFLTVTVNRSAGSATTFLTPKRQCPPEQIPDVKSRFYEWTDRNTFKKEAWAKSESTEMMFKMPPDCRLVHQMLTM